MKQETPAQIEQGFFLSLSEVPGGFEPPWTVLQTVD